MCHLSVIKGFNNGNNNLGKGKNVLLCNYERSLSTT